jgi:hypothetical protein
MRYFYQGTAKDGTGKVITEATISVYLAGGYTVASVYAAASGGVAVNSVTSGASTSSSPGYFSFWVDRGDYVSTQQFRLVISKSGFNSQIYDYISVGVTSQPWVDVKTDFGAVGDGVTNDTAAIALAGATGKNVYFPRGTYLHSGITKSNSSIWFGDGIEQTILKSASATAYLILAEGTIQGEIRDIQIDGNSVANYGVYTNDYGNLQGTLSSMKIIGCTGTPGYGFYNVNNAYSMLLDKMLITGNKVGVYLQGLCQNTVIDRSHIYGNATNDIILGDGITGIPGVITIQSSDIGPASATATTNMLIRGVNVVKLNNIYSEPPLGAGTNDITISKQNIVSIDGMYSIGAAGATSSIILTDDGSFVALSIKNAWLYYFSTPVLNMSVTGKFVRYENSPYIDSMWGPGWGTDKNYSKGTTSGSSCVEFGDMELNSGWNTVGSPAIQALSTVQVHGGTYSRRVNDSTASYGGFVQYFTVPLTVGAKYKVSYWYYLVSGSIVAGVTNQESTETTLGAWTESVKFVEANATTTYTSFYNASNTVAADFYIDDVVVELLTADYLGRLAADPDTAAWGASQEGLTWYNTTTHLKKYWNGSAIKVIATV